MDLSAFPSRILQPQAAQFLGPTSTRAVQGTPAHHAVLLFLPWANVNDSHCHLNRNEIAGVESACLRCLVPLTGTHWYAVTFSEPVPSSRQQQHSQTAAGQSGILAAKSSKRRHQQFQMHIQQPGCKGTTNSQHQPTQHMAPP